MKRFAIFATATVLAACVSPAVVTNVCLYHLGEAGSAGSSFPYTPLVNSGTGGTNQNITSYQNAGSTISFIADGLVTPGSTSALQVIQNSGQSGYYGGPTALSFSNNFAMEVWAKAAAGQLTGNHDVFCMANNSGTVKVSLNGGKWCGLINGTTFSTGAAAATNMWMPVAIIRSNSIARLYVNGVLQPGTGATSPVVASPMLFFGPGGNNGFSGVLDEARVFTFDPAVDDPAASLSLLPPYPVITSQPQAPTGPVYSNTPFSMTVGCIGSMPFSYIWRSNGIPISVSTNATLTTSAAIGVWNYDVIITNSYGMATSTPPVSVTVLPSSPVFVVDLPANVNVFAGGTVHLEPQVTGCGTISCQWQMNGLPISGANNTTLMLTNIPATYSGNTLRVVASNEWGVASSGVAVLNVVALTPPGLPGTSPGTAKSASVNGVYTLSNNLIAMSWSATNGHLAPVAFVNNLATQTWFQAGSEVFRLGHSMLGNTRMVGIRLDTNTVEALASFDGVTWVALQSFSRTNFPGDPAYLQMGKMDKSGANADYSTIGAAGSCRLDSLLVQDAGGATLLQDNFSSLSTNWTLFMSTNAGTAVYASNNWLVADAPANCAAYARQPLPVGVAFASCVIDKGTDQGLSWAPSLCLRWTNGKFLLVGYRSASSTFNVISTPAGEQIFTPSAGLNIAASACTIVSGPQIHASQPRPLSARLGDQSNGQEIIATLQDPASGILINWRAALRDDANYIRQFLTISGTNSGDFLNKVQMLDFNTGNSVPSQVGTATSGNPVTAGQAFFGGESPFANNTLTTNHVSQSVPVALPLGPGTTYDFSSVVGVFPNGQRRRGFIYYLERERAMSYRPLLHYNTWFDMDRSQTEAALLSVIQTCEQEMGRRLGTGLDSYALDDGWDNSSFGFWAVDTNKYPRSFGPLAALAASAGSHLGAWISPLGGYAPTQDGRIQAAISQGIITSSLDLSLPTYYTWWTNWHIARITGDGMNYFKWDNAGSGVTPHFMALIRSAEVLRRYLPSLFLNVTVGTWPSPFWLNSVDCIWRGGGDTGFQGPGNTSERWITYRDAVTYQNIVQTAPLYPVNAVMMHGLICASSTLSSANTIAQAEPDLRHQARSFFGAGFGLQELYITPSLLNSDQWSQVAEAVAWARKRVNVFPDAHWVGGNPGATNVYGWAAWTPERGTLTLRNPSAATNSITLDIAAIFELPPDAPTNYTFTAAYSDQRPTLGAMQAGQAVTLDMAPFEVLVFDVVPATPAATPPSLIQSPLPQSRYAGGVASFQVSATGTAPLAYQWKFNGADIPGANNSTLTLTNLSSAAVGNYSVVVTNLAGVTNSSSAALSVLVPDAPVSAIIASHPLAWWRLGETNGTTAFDSWGSHNGTISGGVVLGAAGSSPASSDTTYGFDGASGRVEVPYTVELNGAVFSVECWARVTAGQGSYRAVVSSRAEPTTGNTQGFIIYATDANKWSFWTGVGPSNTWDYMDGPALVTNQWAHLVGTCNGATKKFYVNGALAASRSIGSYVPNASRPLRVAANSDAAPAYFFPGALDEVVLYDTVLSLQDVSSHYFAATNRVVTPSAPVIHSATRNGSNLVLACGGAANVNCLLLSATDISQPASAWTIAGSNSAGADGLFTNVVPISYSEPRRFYRLAIPWP